MKLNEADPSLADSAATRGKAWLSRTRDTALGVAGRAFGVRTPGADVRMAHRMATDALIDKWYRYVYMQQQRNPRFEGNANDMIQFIGYYFGDDVVAAMKPTIRNIVGGALPRQRTARSPKQPATPSVTTTGQPAPVATTGQPAAPATPAAPPAPPVTNAGQPAPVATTGQPAAPATPAAPTAPPVTNAGTAPTAVPSKNPAEVPDPSLTPDQQRAFHDQRYAYHKDQYEKARKMLAQYQSDPKQNRKVDPNRLIQMMDQHKQLRDAHMHERVASFQNEAYRLRGNILVEAALARSQVDKIMLALAANQDDRIFGNQPPNQSTNSQQQQYAKQQTKPQRQQQALDVNRMMQTEITVKCVQQALAQTNLDHGDAQNIMKVLNNNNGKCNLQTLFHELPKMSGRSFGILLQVAGYCPS